MFPVLPASAARYGRAHHDYPAADVFAPCGTAFVAVTDGRVDEVSAVDPWSSKADSGATRGGRFVSLVGDDGVRYYGSHLAEVTPGIRSGVKVRAGQRLGSIGESGNAKGTGCHVHFGISPPSEPGDWEVRRGTVWPWPYLDAWKAGVQKSPAPEVLSGESQSPEAD